MVSSLLALALAPAVATGFAGLTARRLRDRTKGAERQFRPTGILLRINGRIVHAETAGDGPDLILLHGASGNSREFTFHLMDRLKGRFRTIAFDRPGLGWSDDLGPEGTDPAAQAAQLRAAACKLGVHRPLVLGHSYGGAVALAWALAAPDAAAGLVIVSGASHPWEGSLGPWYALNRCAPHLTSTLVSAWASPAMVARSVASVFAPEAVPEGYIDHIALPLTLRPRVLRANAAQVNGLLPHVRAQAPAYADLALPVEIIHGTADTIVPLAVHGARLAQEVPGAHLTRLHDVGHMPHHTHPEMVIAAIHRAAARAGLH